MIRELAETLLDLAAIAVVYSFLRWALPRFARLSESDYRAPLLVARLFRTPRALLLTFGPSIPLFINWSRLSWSRFGEASWLRPFVVGLAWYVAGFIVIGAKNRFFRQSYWGDRLILGALAMLTVLHPAFIGPLVGLAYVVTTSVLLPLTPHPRAFDVVLIHKLLPLYFLVAFVGTEYVALWSSSAPARFLLFALAIHGASYFYSGIDKLRLSWYQNEELVGLLTAGVAHGAWRSTSWAIRMARWLRLFNRPLVMWTLVIELVVVALCADWLVAVGILAALVMLHAGIFIVAGMNFAAWVLIDLALIASCAVSRDPKVFGPVALAASAVLFLAAPMLLAPIRLAWLDTRLCNTYSFEVVRRSGASHVLSPRDMAPYSNTFIVGKLRYLSDEPLVVDAWGEVYEREVARAIREARDETDLVAVTATYGKNHFKEHRARVMESFLAALLARHDENPDPVAFVKIRLRTLWFDGRTFRIVSDKVVREVPLAA